MDMDDFARTAEHVIQMATGIAEIKAGADGSGCSLTAKQCKGVIYALQTLREGVTDGRT